MPCYTPLRAVLLNGPEGRRLCFSRSAAGEAVSLPCGRCIGCRLERARQWAVRIMHEASLHDENSFLTLTYDDEHLPLIGSLRRRVDLPTLRKSDFQKFMKRLRLALDPKQIRFFACGEYGERRLRPHYHAIIFGHAFADRREVNLPNGKAGFRSEELSRLWGLGFASVGDVSFDSASYVANYATKKIVNKDAAIVDAHYCGRVPEFLLMSRRPGIGARWIERYHSEVISGDEVVVRGHSCRPPRFYDNFVKAKADEEFPPGPWSKILEALKERRAKALSKPVDMVLKSGDVVSVAKSWNDRRLAVRGRVVAARQRIKNRDLEV